MYYRYLPLGVFLSLIVFLCFKGFDYSSAIALFPLAFLAYKYDEKAENSKLKELQDQIKEIKNNSEALAIELEEVKTHMASIKLNQGMKRTF